MKKAEPPKYVLVFEEGDVGVDSYRGVTSVTLEALRDGILRLPCALRQDLIRQLLEGHDEQCLADLLETGRPCEGDVR